jgi:hypothetical protein
MKNPIPALGAAMVALGLGCSSDGDSEASLASLAGGWSNEAENRYVCIASDGRMWLGDSMSELDGPNPCTVDAGGAEFRKRFTEPTWRPAPACAGRRGSGSRRRDGEGAERSLELGGEELGARDSPVVRGKLQVARVGPARQDAHHFLEVLFRVE